MFGLGERLLALIGNLVVAFFEIWRVSAERVNAFRILLFLFRAVFAKSNPAHSTHLGRYPQ